MLLAVVIIGMALAVAAALLGPLVPSLMLGLPVLGVVAGARRCASLGAYWIVSAASVLVLGGWVRWGGLLPPFEPGMRGMGYAELLVNSPAALACLLGPWACVRWSRAEAAAARAAAGLAWGLLAMAGCYLLSRAP